MEPNAPYNRRIDEYWDWAVVALFLLLAVNLLTSMYATAVVGIEHESNPLMSWLFGQSLGVIVVFHIGVGTVVALLFYVLFELVRLTPRTYRGMVMLSVEIYLGLLVAVGLLVFANNVTVIVFGQGLFT